MKKHNKNIMQYLSEAGVLEGSEEEITKAKKEYRLKYKRDWQKNSSRSKTLRPCFTPGEFKEIKQRAELYGVQPTTYARTLVLSSLGDDDLIPNKDKLMHVLQAVGMAGMELIKDSNSIEGHALLSQAEAMLCNYLNIPVR